MEIVPKQIIALLFLKKSAINNLNDSFNRENLAQAFNPKPPINDKKPAKRRQKTMERPPQQKINDPEGSNLLNKWEKQYGGIQDRQFFVKNDHDYDKWHVDNTNQKFSSFNNVADNNDEQDIAEDIPEDPQPKVYVENPLLSKKQNKAETSNGKFDYDWDEEESMSYLKKFNDENLKENYNKYGQNKPSNYNPLPVVSEKQERPKKSRKDKKGSKTKMNTERANNRHFKSVAPQIDDWDD